MPEVKTPKFRIVEEVPHRKRNFVEERVSKETISESLRLINHYLGKGDDLGIILICNLLSKVRDRGMKLKIITKFEKNPKTGIPILKKILRTINGRDRETTELILETIERLKR